MPTYESLNGWLALGIRSTTSLSTLASPHTSKAISMRTQRLTTAKAGFASKTATISTLRKSTESFQKHWVSKSAD
ncbi:MAG: hypothetical protein ACN4GF_09880 [Lentimonas sp.]